MVIFGFFCGIFLVMKVTISDGSAAKLPRRIGSLVFQRSPGGVRVMKGQVVKSRPQFLAKNGVGYFELVARYASVWTTLSIDNKQSWIDVALLNIVPARLGGIRYMKAINAFVKYNLYRSSTSVGLEYSLNEIYFYSSAFPNFADVRFEFFWFVSDQQWGIFFLLDGTQFHNFTGRYYLFDGSYLVEDGFSPDGLIYIPRGLKATSLRFYGSRFGLLFPSIAFNLLVKDIPIRGRVPPGTPPPFT